MKRAAGDRLRYLRGDGLGEAPGRALWPASRRGSPPAAGPPEQPSGNAAAGLCACILLHGLVVYAGLINRQMVFSCHPVVVVGNRGVAASFNSIDEALRFVMDRGFRFGSVYRHDGLNWDKVDFDPLELLEAANRKAQTKPDSTS